MTTDSRSTAPAGKPITLTIKDIEIHGLSWGEEYETKVLALHGWLDNAASFNALGPLLENCHVVAVDLPGHGLSGHWPEFHHYHLWAGVEDVELILDDLGWEKVHLVGHSMGAAISTLYAGSFSDRLNSLTLIEAIGPMAGTLDEAPKRLRTAIESMKAHNPAQQSKEDITPFVQSRLVGPLKLNEASSKQLMARSVGEQGGGYSWRNDKRLRYTSMMRLPEPLIASFIKAIDCPVLGIFANDGLFSEKNVMDRWNLIKAPQILHWYGGGHHLHLEGDVAKISQDILSFFQTAK